MSRNHVVKFCVNEHEWELLQTNARINQIKTVGGYARHVSLGRDSELESRLIETTKLLAKLCKRLKITAVDRDTGTAFARDEPENQKKETTNDILRGS